jgi:hypothetical protein
MDNKWTKCGKYGEANIQGDMAGRIYGGSE